VIYLFLVDITKFFGDSVKDIIIGIAEIVVDGIFQLMGGFFFTLINMLLGLVFGVEVWILQPLIQSSADYSTLLKDFSYFFDGTNSIYYVVKIIALALFSLVIAFQVLKSMYSFLGFESEEPWKIGGKIIIFGI
jgi:hypothetical protein